MKVPKPLSTGEALLATHLRAEGIPFEREQEHVPGRRYRSDFTIDHMFTVEVEGLQWSGKSRHQMVEGYTEDCRKYNALQAAGWRVYRFTTQQVRSGEAIEFIKERLEVPK